MIRAVLFDLDGVVRRFDIAPLAEIERRHGLASGAIIRALFHSERTVAATTGRLADEAWRAAAAAELGPAGPEFLAWQGVSGAVDAEVLDLVRKVRQRVPIGLLTNATSRLDADLRRLDLHNAFDAVVNTSAIGFAKPDARAFAHAAQVLDFPPPEILFVDDTLRNVDAAVELGFVAHHFTGVGGLAALLGERGFL